MSDEFSPIRPKSVPLSHTQTQTDKPSRTSRIPRPATIVISLMIVVGFVVFLVVPNWVSAPAKGAPELGSKVSPLVQPADSPVAPPTNSSPQLPPFQALQREQARARAQEELAQFVELQLKLEQSMQVGTWGQADYDATKTLANEGDEQFLRNEYEQSILSYQSAYAGLVSLIDKGEGLLRDALDLGRNALENREQESATEHYQTALTIDSGNAIATRGLQRAGLLPEIGRLMREARNHELSERWAQAVASYQSVLALDDQTAGISVRMRSAKTHRTQQRITQALSEGFAALDASRLDAAQTGFQSALTLSPDNQIALGGLEQVSEKRVLVEIDDLRKLALRAEQDEAWSAAVSAYESILTVDDNIQFAVEGRLRAFAQRRSDLTLSNIIANPDKLSSKELFTDAGRLLEEAKQLRPRGKILSQQIAETEQLLIEYGKPVPVTLRSDNATLVTLSTVGKLGAFAEKRLELRPGAYTLSGSRDGCQDVRQNILVRPDMQPVDIRCKKTF